MFPHVGYEIVFIDGTEGGCYFFLIKEVKYLDFALDAVRTVEKNGEKLAFAAEDEVILEKAFHRHICSAQPLRTEALPAPIHAKSYGLPPDIRSHA